MKINIISLGRLGLTLYKEFEKLGHNVNGSFCNSSKGVQGEVKYNFQRDALPKVFISGDLLIFNLTPSAISSIDLLKDFISKINYKKIVFISSTSVYGKQGKVDEDTIPIPETTSGEFLVKCEEVVSKHDNCTIIRPGGIIYTDSHPVRVLLRKKTIINPVESINLVAINDLVDSILKLIKYNHKVINVVNSFHPKKREYYNEYCRKNELNLLEFLEVPSIKDKIITSKYSVLKILSKLP